MLLNGESWVARGDAEGRQGGWPLKKETHVEGRKIHIAQRKGEVMSQSLKSGFGWPAQEKEVRLTAGRQGEARPSPGTS